MKVMLDCGEVEARIDVLVAIGIAFLEASEQLMNEGEFALAEAAFRNNHAIYKALDADGYFDDLR